MNELSMSAIIVSSGALFISLCALGLSIYNFWYTNWREGEIQLSQPTIFAFKWDLKPRDNLPKIMFRSALFCTAKRGAILESMYLIVSNREGQSKFSFWGYDDGKGMVRGSGLFIGDTGHVAYHHFNPARNDKGFKYCLSEYKVEVWGRFLHKDTDFQLGIYKFNVADDDLAMALEPSADGVLWDWLPQEREYVGIVM